MKRLHKLLTRCGSDAASLGGIYRTLFALDLTISPVLARDLFLIDEVGRSRQSARRKRGAALRVPEWAALWPDGWIDEQYLLRHTFISGETGSGKTASGVMPLVRGMLSAPCSIGCALIVDPKRELLPAVRDLVEDVRVVEPSGPGRRASMLNLFSAPHWDVDGDLEAGLVQDAARKILTRSAELATRTPAAVWAGLEAGYPRQGYWDHEGGSLAAVAVSLALAVISRRSAIFAEGRFPTLDTPSARSGARGTARLRGGSGDRPAAGRTQSLGHRCAGEGFRRTHRGEKEAHRDAAAAPRRGAQRRYRGDPEAVAGIAAAIRRCGSR